MKVLLNNEILIDNCKVADNFFDKLLGKIFCKRPLLLKNCNSIHTFFIKENLDIIFLDKDNRAVKIYQNFSPNKIILPIKNATSVLEISTGSKITDIIRTGEILGFVNFC